MLAARSLPFLSLLIGVSSVLSSCSREAQREAELDYVFPVTLKIGGAEAAKEPVREVASAFSQEYPLVQFLHTEGAQGSSIEQLITEEIEIARISRELTSDEFSLAAEREVSMGVHPIGYDAVAIVVHPSVAADLKPLSLELLNDIFFGRRDVPWSELGGSDSGMVKPVVYSSHQYDGPDMIIRERVSGAGSTRWAENVQEVDYAHEVVARVSRDRDCIGFSARAQLNESVAVMPLLREDGEISIMSEITVMDRTYPLSRTTSLVVRQPVTEAVRDFILFCYEPTSRMLIRHRGLLPIHQ